jgi:hypothetical protein
MYCSNSCGKAAQMTVHWDLARLINMLLIRDIPAYIFQADAHILHLDSMALVLWCDLVGSCFSQITGYEDV